MEIFVKDFSEYPGLRHCSISDDSGEEFYHEILNYKFKECFERDETLIVNIDYTAGYAPSFLDEAFGNLVFDFSLLNIKKLLIRVTVGSVYSSQSNGSGSKLVSYILAS